LYTLETGDRSRIEIPVGSALKEEYDHTGRLRLEVAGDPKWDGKQGQLQIQYDEIDDTFRAFQPVTVPDSQQDSPLASEEAALDVGANNLIACTTTTGQQYLYEGRDLFDHFRETTDEIARLQSKLREGRYSSNRIRQLYQKRTRRRDHAQEALARDLMERLYTDGVETVYVGDLTDVLSTHWCAEVNARLTSSGPFGRSSIAYCTQPRNTASGLRCSQKPIQPERARCVANERIPIATATCSGVRAATKHTPICVRLEHSSNSRLANSKAGRWLGPCASRGTTTTGQRHHTLPRGKSQRGAHKPEYRQRESCLRGYGIANIPPEESSRFSAGGRQT